MESRKMINATCLLLLCGLTAISRAETAAPVFNIPRLPDIQVDGDVTDWEVFGYRVEIMAGRDNELLPTNDFDAQFQLAWDDGGLLLLVLVRDDVAAEYGETNRLYRMDSVEIFMAEKVGSANRFQLYVAPGTDPKYGKLRTHFYDYRPEENRDPPLSVTAAAAAHAGGYVLEALLPWENLNLAPAPELELGFQLYINDSDGEGGYPDEWFRLLWHPGWDSHLDPKKMHRVRLADRPSPPAQAVVRSRMLPNLGRAEVSVIGIPLLAGKSLAVRDDEAVLAATKLDRCMGRSSARVRIPFPAIGRDWADLRAVIAGGIVEPLGLPSAQMTRERELLSQRILFSPFCFAGTAFPQCEFEHPAAVEHLIGPYELETRHFDARFNEVTEPREPGRYGAVVLVVPQHGRPFRRFHTLFRLPERLEWWNADFSVSFGLPDEFGIDPRVLKRYAGALEPEAGAFLSRAAREDPRAGAMFAGLSEARLKGPDIDAYNDLSATDRQWWVTLKRQLWPAAGRTEQFACPRPIEGEPAPTLRKGSAADAGMTRRGVGSIGAVCREWAANSDQAFAVCLARRGRIFLHKSYGVRDGRKMTVTTRSWMASITKLISGTAMMMLVDRGLADLDAPIGQYLPPFRGIAAKRALTIRRLYNHTNGLRGHWGDYDHDLEERVARLYPLLEVGERYEYNGAGYSIAGKIVEAVTGEALPQFYKKHLLDPLGCRHTEITDSSGGAESVPLDMARLAQMLLNRGAYGTHRFFSEQTFLRMLPVSLAGLPGGPDEWGVGTRWCRAETWWTPLGGLSDEAFGHGAASSATFIVDPGNELVIVMTRNSAGANFTVYYEKFIRAVVDAMEET